MKAINYYLVVDKIKEEPKKIAGLIITEKTDEEGRYAKAKVVSAGNLVEGVKDGDLITYDKHAGHAITWKDSVYYVIKIQDIIIVE
jgi:co-chaperonin GroES (HSP10)